ncbi:MAG: hypothetical protein WBW33_32265 [Bryobacteraceae bacterium]
MPDELPSDMQNLWRDEPGEPVRISVDALRRKAQKFEAETRRGFRNAGILMICLAACYLSFLYFFPGILQRIGASLTLAAYLYCGYQFRKNGPVKRLLADAPAATCAAYQSELKRLRDFSLISTLLLPFIPGPALFVMGFLVPQFGLVKAVSLTAALIASPFLLAIPLLRRKRQVLESEIDALDALMR